MKIRNKHWKRKWTFGEKKSSLVLENSKLKGSKQWKPHQTVDHLKRRQKMRKVLNPSNWYKIQYSFRVEANFFHRNSENVDKLSNFCRFFLRFFFGRHFEISKEIFFFLKHDYSLKIGKKKLFPFTFRKFGRNYSIFSRCCYHFVAKFSHFTSLFCQKYSWIDQNHDFFFTKNVRNTHMLSIFGIKTHSLLKSLKISYNSYARKKRCTLI